MKLAYVTRSFPYAHLGETFLEPEVRALSCAFAELHILPVRPHLRKCAPMPCGNTIAARVSAPGFSMLFAAASEAAIRPLPAARALYSLLVSRYRLTAKIKNVALFPAALAMARYVRKHRIDHIHAHWLTTPATAAYIASRLTGIPWSCTAHAHDIFSDNLLKEKTASASFMRVIAQRNLLHLADLTGYPREAMHLIHVGVNIPEPAAHTERDDTLRIVCAARLDPIKGHEYLIRALAQARDNGLPFRCDIVGTGPMGGRLRSAISAAGLGTCVVLRGLVPYRSLLAELRAGNYDVLVLPSIEFDRAGGHEGIPVALIEAMAHAIPCVATATGCIPELIDRNTGILVPQRDAGALAQAFMRLGADTSLRQTLGAAARRRVIEDFDAASTSRALRRLIEDARP